MLDRDRELGVIASEWEGIVRESVWFRVRESEAGVTILFARHQRCSIGLQRDPP